jgi:predicted nucleotidyltransferase component of viral defense system
MATIIEERLQKYAPQTSEEGEVALKEILQEIILCGLSDAGFFENAIFQGGTSLRIFHNLARFSEDLDFILKKQNPDFKWQPFLQAIEDICKLYGIVPEVVDKSRAGHSVQKMFLKDNSIIKFLNLSFRHAAEKKLTIKLEIDVNPPEGSSSEIKFLDFPLAAEVEVQDLPSNFAGKIHALLCRTYIKGRDWYDFLWYVAHEISPNFNFLSSAINQQGPWADQRIHITPAWFLNVLEEKIHTVDWKKAADDVSAFLNERDRKRLKFWGIPFFQDRVAKLSKTLIHRKEGQ